MSHGELLLPSTKKKELLCIRSDIRLHTQTKTIKDRWKRVENGGA